VWTRWTTRCCSALALIALVSTPIAAQSTSPAPSLFPVRPLWTLALNNQITFPPAYDDSLAVFAIEHDRLVAYDLVTGIQKWLVAARPQTPLGIGGGLVFVSEPESLRAIRAADGSTAWTLPLPEKLSVAPVWDNGWLVIATAAGELVAFRAADGLLVWRAGLGSTAHARPALAADRVYVPTDDGRIVAVKVDTGERLWDRQLGGPGNEILANDQRLYVGSRDNFFYCLLAADGRVDWRWRTGADVIGQPVLDGNLVYFLSLDNVLRALHHTSGVQRWRASIPLRPVAGPVKAVDVLIVTGVGPSLPALNLSDGRPAGELPAAGEAAAPPHVFSLQTGFPIVITVGRDIANGATVTAMTRSSEPKPAPMAPLPNVIPPGATTRPQ
jgi:outer membrane protein assembly factor BamB